MISKLKTKFAFQSTSKFEVSDMKTSQDTNSWITRIKTCMVNVSAFCFRFSFSIKLEYFKRLFLKIVQVVWCFIYRFFVLVFLLFLTYKEILESSWWRSQKNNRHLWLRCLGRSRWGPITRARFYSKYNAWFLGKVRVKGYKVNKK